jgi:phosphate-selective porin OprO/OprP
MRTFQIALVAALISGGVLPDQNLRAEETLEERVSNLEKRTAYAEAGQNGFLIKSGDGDFQLRLSAYVQADGRTFIGDDQPAATNTFFIRRARPILQGTVGRHHSFSIVPDFGQGATVVQDAYYENTYVTQAKLRAGKFKTPFGLERLETDPNTHFAELALPSSLVPNRDIGAQIAGQSEEGTVAYAIGVFNGNPDNTTTDADTNDSKDAVGRVFFTHRGFGAGVGATYGKQAAALPSFKTTGGQTFFSYTGALADGERVRLSPQGYYYAGPFGLLGEYVQSAQEIRKSGTLSKVKHSAWQAATSIVLTGEKNSYADGITPAYPFDPRNGHWGAFELAARFSELNIDDDVFALGFASPTSSVSRARGRAVGINWYLTRHVKYVLNYERTSFTGGAAGGTNREPENLLLCRIQLYI